VLVDHLLTNPDTGVMAAELVPVATALKSMKRSNSGVTWIRQRHVTAFLKDLAVAPTITHERLDELPGADRTRNYIRGLLVEHGALPRRDEFAVRYDQWAAGALERVSSDEHRDVVRRYFRWHLQRRMNQMETVPYGTFLRSKQTVTVAIEFLNWLHDHGLTLNELRQEHLDAWLADGPSTRRFVDRFIPWAIKCRLVDPELTIARHRRGTSPKLSKSEQDAAVERVVHTDELSVRDQAAAILVVVFGQHIEDVVQLTWDDVIVTDEVVTIRLGKTEFALRSPLDEPMRQLAAAPGNDLTASHPNSNWVFRGYSPGRHIHGSSLRSRLKTVFSTRAARLGTLHELTKLGPVPIIADALGYHPSTIERHAISSASTYAEYMAAVRELKRTS
jgi:integrase